MNPTIISKAYTCKVDRLDSGYDVDLVEVFHADSASKAKMKAFREWDFEDIRALFCIKVKRAKYADLVENKRHPLVETISDEGIKKMLHAVGWDQSPVFSNNPYRNYYQVDHDEDFEKLIELGLAVKQQHIGLNYYHLTDLGKEVAYSTKPIERNRLIN